MDKEKNPKEKNIGYTFYIQIPTSQHVHIQGWDNECKAKFKDDRYQKMMHDHLFVFNFKSRLKALETKIDEVLELLKPKTDSSDLFKKE